MRLFNPAMAELPPPLTPFQGCCREYVVLGRLKLRFSTQRVDSETGEDIISARDPKTNHVQDVWFSADIPSKPDQAKTDEVARAIMISGDGLTPDTAFVIGGAIMAEYEIPRYMGIQSDL